MQLNTKQIKKILKEVEKPKVSTRYTRNPLRSKREVDNLYSMQVWAMEELWKALEINKNKNN